jgi:type I restriction enzyme S subunit
MLNEEARNNQDVLPYLANFNVQWGRFDFSRLNKMHFSEKEKEKFSLRKGDLLVCEGGEVGRGAIWREEVEPCFYQKALHRLRPLGNTISTEFMLYYLQFISSGKMLSRLTLESSIAHLTRETLLKLPIIVPPIAVQKRIVDTLSAWDTAIEKAEQLIALRKRQQKWLATHIANQPGCEHRLGDFLRPSLRAVPKPTQAYRALGIRSHGKGTFQRLVENPETIDMDELFTVKRDDLIVNITFAWEGAIAIVKPEDEGCLVSHRFPTYEFDRNLAIPEFVKFLINRKPFFTQLALISPGGAGRNRVLNKKDFLKLTLDLPDIPEQRRFAEILGMMDRLIEIETELLLKLKEQKRGLMQKLLTGEWRVKVEGTEAA